MVAANWKALVISYPSIVRQVGTISRLTGLDFESMETFQLWNGLLQLVSFTSEADDVVETVLRMYPDDPSEALTSLDHLKPVELIIAQIQLACPQSPQLKDKLASFGAQIFQLFVSKHSQNSEYLQSSFEKILPKIELGDNFYLTAKKIIQELISFTLLGEEMLKVAGLPVPESEDTPVLTLDWLDKCLRQFPRRLPYLLINHLTSQLEVRIQSENNSERLDVRGIFARFERISPIDPLGPTEVCVIAATRCLLDIYAQSRVNTTKDPLIGRISDCLDFNRPTSKSLQLYVLKRVKYTQKLNQEGLETICERSIKESWAAFFLQSFRSLRPAIPLNSECILIDGKDAYKEIGVYFDSFVDYKADTVEEMLAAMSNRNDRHLLAAYYCQVINRFYLSPVVVESRHKDYLEEVNKNREGFIGVFGETGFEFVNLLLTNFGSMSPLRYNSQDSREILCKKVSTLFAFSLLLSLKHEQSHLSRLFWDHPGTEVPLQSIPQTWKSLYLPGAIIEDNPRVILYTNFLNSLAEYGPTDGRLVYKCSQNCDYYFVFADCGQPNDLQNTKCPFCSTPMGASSSRSHFHKPHHIPISRAEAILRIRKIIEAHQMTVTPGLYNFNLSIAQHSTEGFNIHRNSTNIFNFLMNSAVLVLSELISPQNITSVLAPSLPFINFRQRNSGQNQPEFPGVDLIFRQHRLKCPHERSIGISILKTAGFCPN